MKVALIPPVPNLTKYAPLGDIHMTLAGLFDEPGYVDFYRREAERGAYVILDNGAHETQTEGMNVLDLLDLAAQVRASEIVMPDVPGNAIATYEASLAALGELTSPFGIARYKRAGMPRLMYVPQGRTIESWRACLRKLMRAHEDVRARRDVALRRPVLAIAKHHIDGLGEPARAFRAAIYEEVSEQGIYSVNETDIHVLGWPRKLWELATIHSRVRSSDSARPFVYAQNGILLEPGGDIPRYPSRDPRYFQTPITEAQDEYALRNILVYRATAQGRIVR